MPLAPGPVQYLFRDPATLDPDPPSLEPWEAAQQADWAAWERELDRQAGELGGVMEFDLAGPIEAEIAAAAGELDAIPWDDLPPGAEEDPAARPELATDIIAGYREIPGEAFQPLPPKFAPPLEQPGFSPAGEGRERGGNGSGPRVEPPTVQLENLSGGSPDLFRVGDPFGVRITGPAGGIVAVQAWQNGVDMGVWSWPDAPIDELGRWSLEGAMELGHIGVWLEVWSVYQDPISPVLNFEVRGG